MLEIRKTFIFIFSLNLIIVTVPREIGNFRQKFAEIQPAEIIDSLKQSLGSIKEKSVNNDDDFVPTAKSPIDDKNTSIEEEVTLTDVEGNNLTEKPDEIEKVSSNEDVADNVAKTEKVPLDEDENLGSKEFDEETKIADEIDEDSENDDNQSTTDDYDDDDEEEEEPLQKVDDSQATFKLNRDSLMQMEEDMAFGSDVILSEDEKKVNDTLMDAKFKEFEIGFADEGKFLPKSNFLRVKDEIEKSKVFKMLQKMPKGCLLHAHDVGTVSQEYVLRNVTYRPNLYACDGGGKLQLRFFEIPDDNCNWKLLSELRATPESEEEINQRIRQHMSMMTENPEKAYPDGDKAWIKFQSLFQFLGSFMRYRPVYEDYYYELLKENYADEFLYVELRSSFSSLYELNGTKHESMKVAKIVIDISDRFVKEHPDFIGVKIIYSKNRHITLETLKDFLKTFQELKNTYPNFIVGFDLVGQENKGYPLKNFTKELLELKSEHRKFIFHAGETDWNGLSTDENLIDAVLLRTKRIGHGFALPKHPKVMEVVKKQDIAIEVNPISNQVLNLVADLRNHPASILFAENYPVVVSSDDAGLWGARGLSYDFYEAFMGIMSRKADLRALIKLGYNSIKYSSMTDKEKTRAFNIFNKQWSEFVRNFNETEY